jgi:hypothetical protein
VLIAGLALEIVWMARRRNATAGERE